MLSVDISWEGCIHTDDRIIQEGTNDVPSEKVEQLRSWLGNSTILAG